jgi:glycosyltransferase involved in cell wall biosynthesis
VLRLAASGRYRAVVCGTVGRTALPAAYVGARRARVPFVLWSALWAQPRSLAGIAGGPLIARIYRRADAIVTYGPHVSEYVRRHGARRVFEAPQAVDNEFWSTPVEGAERRAPFQAVFVGRMEPEKGAWLLLEAWPHAAPDPSQAALVLVGDGVLRGRSEEGATFVGPQPPEQVRNFLASSDVLVMPSLPTRSFREPWGLAVNEAMNQGLAVIATDAVGAAAGGLVRDGRNGLIVPARDVRALAGALARLREDPQLRSQLGAAGREDVRENSFEAWVDGFSRALSASKAVC